MTRRSLACFASIILLFLAGPAWTQTGPEQRDIAFAGENGVPLAGTLLLPARAAGERVPAVLLVQGSGPTDRDGNQRPSLVSDLLRALAEAATARGFATLRFDKRGMHANAASFPPADRMADFFRWENFTGDARAAFRALAQMPEIDPARIVILGHSEGGLIALVVAANATAEARPAGLVLAAAPGRAFDVILREQIRASLQRSGATPVAREIFLGAFDDVIAHIKRTGEVPAGLSPPLNGLFQVYLGPFFKSAFAADPAELARKVAGPVLILQGELDLQISAERDAAVLLAALRQRSGGDQTLRVFSRLSHNFKPTAGPADHAFAGALPDAVSAALTEWLAARFKPAR